MEIRFLGTDCCNHSAGNDASGILINKRILIDTGFYCVQNLLNNGIIPEDIEHIVFTHLHHDHYMGLPQIIFRYLQNNKPLSKLNIYGPKADVDRIVKLSFIFLQAGKDDLFFTDCGEPVIHELSAGDEEDIEALHFEMCESFHPVDGLCYRITDVTSGKVLGITGDTFYKDSIADSLHDCDLLIHETALRCSEVDIDNPPSYLHSNIDLAILTAKKSRAKRLFTVHYPAVNADEVIKKAAELCDIEVIYPLLNVGYEV